MELILHISILLLFYGCMLLSLNFLTGYTGLLTLSHGAFYGISTYIVAILTKNYQVPFLSAVSIAIIIIIILAYLLSIPFTKVKEDTYLFMTLGFTIIVFNLANALTNITNGPLGIKSIPDINLFGWIANTKLETFFVFLVIFLLTLRFFSLIINSVYSTILKGIRDNETYMQTLGFNTKKYLRTAFTLSALVPGILGGFTGAYYGYIDPKYFELFFSLNYAIAIIIGGLASIRGSLIGAVILVTIPEALRFIGLPNTIIGPTQQIIFCSILIVLIYLKPKGIFGDYQI